MPEPTVYQIRPTKLVPNSPKPLLHYKGYFNKHGKPDAATIYDAFRGNGWDVQWVTRYGKYQRSHYHPETHEAMAVLSGPGIIRWGVADTDDDGDKHTYGTAHEEGALQTEANAGDVFVIPAGVAHKSFDPQAPEPDAQCLTGGYHGIDGENPREIVGRVPLSGFTMMGAYPRGCSWSWAEGGDHLARFEAVWNVPLPTLDPVVGGEGGVGAHWK
ncbi:FAD-dependent pyridine nucleotide-disulfide oxidoreductase [Metarhizium guizhouense ARSEF 977]|uniref:FAD-dependent pyridine nucleotide-disulfide oxidoreductase n=1 Tax=Metarhizium guizhouense (strain ARSEF 977) TaxID=1276136 RepID=A0A0B4HBJ3_METGA|nr:FAD-dependent pyridine nucleotide-disulfide oxidoreductase [Metarhizium guizhouense ARSEF 977]